MATTDVPYGFTRRTIKGGRIVYAPDGPVVSLHELFVESLGDVSHPKDTDCIRSHVGNRFFYKLDIQGAYDCVTQELFTGTIPVNFEGLGGNLGQFFFHEGGGLIQGAPASPKMFELYCQHTIDPQLNRFCIASGFTWSRYVDDILVSHPKKRIVERHRKVLRNILIRNSFVVHPFKTCSYDNMLQPFVYIGVHFHQGKVRTTDKARRRLVRSEVGSHVRHGCMAWQNHVLAMNMDA